MASIMTPSPSPASFQEDIRSNWAAINQQSGNAGKNPKDAAKRAWAVFNNTFSSPLPFIVIGPDRLRENSELTRNIQWVTSDHGGAILGESQWSVLINDAFILGAIQARKQVFLVPKKDGSAPFYDMRSRGLTSVGRELAILQAVGYRRVNCPSKYGIGFKCDEEQLVEELTLKKLWAKLPVGDCSVALNQFLNDCDCR